MPNTQSTKVESHIDAAVAYLRELAKKKRQTQQASKPTTKEAA